MLDKVGSKAQHSVMFEDSMKNLRAAKSIGMKTCLVTGKAEKAAKNKDMVMAIKAGDCPDAQDECVDYALGVCSDMVNRLPFLWDKTWHPRNYIANKVPKQSNKNIIDTRKGINPWIFYKNDFFPRDSLLSISFFLYTLLFPFSFWSYDSLRSMIRKRNCLCVSGY